MNQEAPFSLIKKIGRSNWPEIQKTPEKEIREEIREEVQKDLKIKASGRYCHS